MSVTIDDISKHLGISVSTVSKALNGYDDVSPRTRTRVVEATEQLGYYPNGAARSLRRGRTDKIGLLLNHPVKYLSDYVGDVMSGAVLAADKLDQNLVLYSKEVRQAEELRRICRTREVDGLLLLFDPSAAMIAVLKAEQTPFVIFGRISIHSNVSYVAPDNFTGAYKLTQHLIAEGHRRIAFTTRPQLGMTNESRFDGYRQALRDSDIPLNRELICETSTHGRSGYDVLNDLLDLPMPPTALFAFYDLIAIDALRAAYERGLRVPDDIAIAGFDGLKPAERSRPPLTTVRQPLAEMGERAIGMVMAQLENRTRPAEQFILPVDLIVRASTRVK